MSKGWNKSVIPSPPYTVTHAACAGQHLTTLRPQQWNQGEVVPAKIKHRHWFKDFAPPHMHSAYQETNSAIARSVASHICKEGWTYNDACTYLQLTRGDEDPKLQDHVAQARRSPSLARSDGAGVMILTKSATTGRSNNMGSHVSKLKAWAGGVQEEKCHRRTSKHLQTRHTSSVASETLQEVRGWQGWRCL